MEEIISDKFDIKALLEEHLNVLVGGLGSGILIPGRHIMIDYRYTRLILRAVSCGKRIRIACIYGLKLKLRRPLCPELILIDQLITLKPASLHIRSVGYTLKMRNYGSRLINDPLAVLPHLKCKIRVLTISRGKVFIKASDFFPKSGLYHYRRTRDIIYILDIVVFRL